MPIISLLSLAASLLTLGTQAPADTATRLTLPECIGLPDPMKRSAARVPGTPDPVQLDPGAELWQSYADRTTAVGTGVALVLWGHKTGAVGAATVTARPGSSESHPGGLQAWTFQLNAPGVAAITVTLPLDPSHLAGRFPLATLNPSLGDHTPWDVRMGAATLTLPPHDACHTSDTVGPTSGELVLDVSGETVVAEMSVLVYMPCASRSSAHGWRTVHARWSLPRSVLQPPPATRADSIGRARGDSVATLHRLSSCLHH